MGKDGRGCDDPSRDRAEFRDVIPRFEQKAVNRLACVAVLATRNIETLIRIRPPCRQIDAAPQGEPEGLNFQFRQLASPPVTDKDIGMNVEQHVTSLKSPLF